MLESILKPFLEQAKTDNLKTSHFPNDYAGLEMKVSFGHGNTAKIPWISFLAKGQSTSNGIYPVYLFYKDYEELILAYGVSETNPPARLWEQPEGVLSIKEYFSKKQLKPDRYGGSFVYKTYQLNAPIDWTQAEADLAGLIKEYQDVLARSIVQPIKSKFVVSIADPIHFAIKSKPFIILAGLSGTGKSRLVRSLAYQFCNLPEKTDPPANYQLIKVKPNWHDSSELLGYESRINGSEYIITDFMRFILKAWQHKNTPFFLCLDEMNLAPVEQYFAEYLSVIETRNLKNGEVRTDALINGSMFRKYAEQGHFNLWQALEIKSNPDLQNQLKERGLTLPPNLIVMGTVNMDETTHSISRKVLDRAMTIEMNEIDLSSGLDGAADESQYPEQALNPGYVLPENTHGHQVYDQLGMDGESVIDYLKEVNLRLENSPFKIAYRVRDEFLLYVYNYSLYESKPDNWLNDALDAMTLMKILPRIEGDSEKTKVLDSLVSLFEQRSLTRSIAKAKVMIQRRDKSHYTSFWV